jgi:hypothetical protein
MKASDVIGKYLIAEVDVPIYAFPGGSQIGVVKKGLVAGPVFSWIEKNGKLYWAFDYTIPGQAPGSYYAEHRPSYWKLSTTAAGGAGLPTNIETPSLLPKWALPVGIGALALFLFK